MSLTNIIIGYDVNECSYLASVKGSPMNIIGRGKTVAEASDNLRKTYMTIVESVFKDSLSPIDGKIFNKLRKDAINIKHGDVKISMDRYLHRNIIRLVKLNAESVFKVGYK